MKLKVGDVVEFKDWEYMADNESKFFVGGFSPKSGKITEIKNNGFFVIEDWKHVFSPESVARVISDADDGDDFNPGDEIWVKTTVNGYYRDTVFLNPIERFVNKDDVLKTVKHRTSERFIVKEGYYGMYIGESWKLVSDRHEAKIYAVWDTANDDAIDMDLNEWDVITYDD